MGDTNLPNFISSSCRVPRDRPEKRTVRWSAIGAVTGALIGTALAAIPTLASIFARTVVTPEPHPAEDVRIYKYAPVNSSEKTGVIELAITHQTTVRGRYALVFNEGRGVARIGEVIATDRRKQTVTRVVEKVYSGELADAGHGRWAGFVWPTPREAGYSYQDVMIPVDDGLAPAWLIDPVHQTQHRNTWLITVHGRGSKRNEGLRMMSS